MRRTEMPKGTPINWSSLVEKRIKDAMADGKFDNLPGHGKPLRLEDDEHVPEHLRLTHKLLRDNDLVPVWITERTEIEERREQLLAKLRRAGRRYHEAATNDRYAAVTWSAAANFFREEADRFNMKVIGHNLKLPPGVAHLPLLRIEREIQRARNG